MTAIRLDGKLTAATIRSEIRTVVERRLAAGLPRPGLVAILVGDNPASQTYVRNKHKACEEVGFHGLIHRLPATTTQAELLATVEAFNHDPLYHGILVQLPLPKQIDETAVLQAVTPLKDVDCFHPVNVGQLAAGFPRFYPCTPHGVIELVRRAGLSWAGQPVVVVGRSNIVGKPLALMLMQKPTAAHPAGGDATVTVAHTKTADLAAVCRRASILVAAAGIPALITPEMVRPGAIVVDVGTNMVDGKLVGDVHPTVADVAGYLSPVPGGVGPMTITMLLQNTLTAAELLAPTPGGRSQS
ncbi:MAG: bifunctional 5,10-methylenetetrahydrofolate dehydrogenase/5,10-methenyltetrahydrofolate cyclohydrolase [Gemmataceae bacterium]